MFTTPDIPQTHRHLESVVVHPAAAYVSIRQHTSAYVSIRHHTSAYVSMRQHASAYVSIRVSIRVSISGGALRCESFINYTENRQSITII